MSKRLLFFATKNDLKMMLTAVEDRLPIEYVRMGQGRATDGDRYVTSVEIPNLGLATTDSAVTAGEFLVTPKGHPVEARPVLGNDGVTRYFFDQLANPGTVTFAPGGLWGDAILLHGRIATVTDHETSQALMSEFGKALRKSFRRIKAFWVGPEAERLLDAGKRLTISAQSSKEFDLTRAG
jgi:hypothetical protein